MVAEAYVVSPGKWTRKASAELGIPQRSVQRMIKKLKLEPYRPSLLQALHEDDTDRQLEFCETIIIQAEPDQNLLCSILWTDEAYFKLNGRVNRHNCVYWSDVNPHLVIQEELNVSGGMVWGCILSSALMDPYFFEGSVISNSYIEMLREVVFPELENSPFVQYANAYLSTRWSPSTLWY